MNWLMYIGGGIIFYVWVFGILNTVIKIEGKKLSSMWQYTLGFATLSVWIWVCWRFIK